MMKTPKLILPSRQSSLSQLNRLLKTPRYAGAKYIILTDENSSEHCLPLLITTVEAFQESEFLEIESGEQNKTLEVASQLWQALLDMSADRDCVIVNLGGGVITDMGGMVAAAFKRGVRYINIPTTLLAMTDAAIGGKTAVNVNGIKNQVGFFYQPEVICVEPAFLNTLPDREYLSGVCEMIKTLMVGDAELYVQLCDTIMAKKPIPQVEMIRAAVQIKTAVVKADMYDNGMRKILNWGHTLGHAIESFSLNHTENPLTHGEAIAIGMVGEAYLSMKKAGLPVSEYERIKNLITSLVSMPKYNLKDLPQLMDYIKGDKKNSNNTVYCTMLRNIGEAVIDMPICENEICDALMNLN